MVSISMRLRWDPVADHKIDYALDRTWKGLQTNGNVHEWQSTIPIESYLSMLSYCAQ